METNVLFFHPSSISFCSVSHYGRATQASFQFLVISHFLINCYCIPISYKLVTMIFYQSIAVDYDSINLNTFTSAESEKKLQNKKRTGGQKEEINCVSCRRR